MRNRIRRLLPHAAILICNMYIVFYLIDRVNTAMNFIDNGLTKGLLVALAVITFFNCLELLRLEPAARRRSAPPSARRLPTQANPRGGYSAARGRYEQGSAARDGRYPAAARPGTAGRGPAPARDRGGRGA